MGRNVKREAVSGVLRRLHLYGVQGWWDAGTDIKSGNYSLRQWRKHGWKARWWAINNWLHGYSFSAVRRFRCCGHTTPSHTRECWFKTMGSR